MRSRLVPVDVPLDLRRTLRPLTMVWGVYADDGWWRPVRTPDGPATVRLRREPGGVRADAWGDGADWILDRVPDWIGLADRPEDLITDHPLVSELARRGAGRRFGRTGLVFEAACHAVISQKVTGREARAGLVGITRRFSGPAPGPRPGLWLPPAAERLARVPYHRLHDLGVERRRADTLRRVASRADRLEGIGADGPAATRRALETLPGVGEWTSAETVAVSHGDPDAVSVGDFHHKHLVAWHLAAEPRGTDARMLELLEPFRPHRGRVVRLMEGHGRYPRYGPKQPIRNFRAS